MWHSGWVDSPKQGSEQVRGGNPWDPLQSEPHTSPA